MRRRYILPCEIGDTVWRIKDGHAERGVVESFTIEGDDHLLRVVVGFPRVCLSIRADLIGKEIYLHYNQVPRGRVKRYGDNS